MEDIPALQETLSVKNVDCDLYAAITKACQLSLRTKITSHIFRQQSSQQPISANKELKRQKFCLTIREWLHSFY